MNKFKLAVCQVKQYYNKLEIIEGAEKKILEATQNGASVIVLGECWNALYTKKYMTQNAERARDHPDSPSYSFMKKMAKKTGTYLFGGSIPEIADDGKLYNTAFVFDSEGKEIGKYRKTHLFDIDIPGKATYKESDIFSAGTEACVVQTEFGKVGMGICYDLRFPELSLGLTKHGAEIFIYPGNFSYPTGQLHWEILLRARSLDTQTYVIGASVARFLENQEIYQTWAHSTIIDPMATVIAQTGERPDIIYGDIDLEFVRNVRKQIPNQVQKRNDIYNSL